MFQTMEAGINAILLFGAAALFLSTVETRLKRARALRLLHQLRSLPHVVDMHQLETLTTGLSGKIWQKISLLTRHPADAG